MIEILDFPKMKAEHAQSVFRHPPASKHSKNDSTDDISALKAACTLTVSRESMTRRGVTFGPKVHSFLCP